METQITLDVWERKDKGFDTQYWAYTKEYGIDSQLYTIAYTKKEAIENLKKKMKGLINVFEPLFNDDSFFKVIEHGEYYVSLFCRVCFDKMICKNGNPTPRYHKVSPYVELSVATRHKDSKSTEWEGYNSFYTVNDYNDFINNLK